MDELLQRSFMGTQELYLGHHYAPSWKSDPTSHELHIRAKLESDFHHVKDAPAPVPAADAATAMEIEQAPTPNKTPSIIPTNRPVIGSAEWKEASESGAGALVLSQNQGNRALALPAHRRPPVWHNPWEMMRVISGHTGWVRCCAVDPSNEWFATGSADRTIIVWDLASGTRKVTLTGHIATVRDVVISARQPYLFSVGEDKMVKCWDLEANQVVRSYHGHLNGVYCAALHPTIDVLMTGGRDGAVRVWDIRTKAEAMILTGHKSTIGSILTQSTDPQVVSASHDSTIRLWDLAAGKADVVLTNHKKAVRALAAHPTEYAFLSASADNTKQWQYPLGKFVRNFAGQRAIINSLAVNSDDVVASGGDDGSLYMWDWKTGHCFQKLQTIPQPGSLESEAGIFCTQFDQTGCRLITCEADKSIKIWREVEDATPETHPNEKWQPSLKKKRY